jgi:hypothetical protein
MWPVMNEASSDPMIDRVGKLLREAEATHRNTRHQSRLVLWRARVRIQKCESCQILGRRKPQWNPIDATFHTVCKNICTARKVKQ